MQESGKVSAEFKLGQTSRRVAWTHCIYPDQVLASLLIDYYVTGCLRFPLHKVRRHSHPPLRASVRSKNGDSGKGFRLVLGTSIQKHWQF